jgi:hypothetical protein
MRNDDNTHATPDGSHKTEMTETQAKLIALASDGEYRARKMRGRWVVWCDASEHAVDIDNLEQAIELIKSKLGVDHD